jgi:hypothetical protein
VLLSSSHQQLGISSSSGQASARTGAGKNAAFPSFSQTFGWMLRRGLTGRSLLTGFAKPQFNTGSVQGSDDGGNLVLTL